MNITKSVCSPALQAERRPEAAESPASAKGLRNQFNFSERGAQTMLFMPKHRAIQVDNPPTAEASGECSAWGVYDTYMQEAAQQRHQVLFHLHLHGSESARSISGLHGAYLMPSLQEEAAIAKAGKKGQEGEASSAHSALVRSSCINGIRKLKYCRILSAIAEIHAPNVSMLQVASSTDPLASPVLLKSLKLLERICSHNTCPDISLDFKVNGCEMICGNGKSAKERWRTEVPVLTCSFGKMRRMLSRPKRARFCRSGSRRQPSPIRNRFGS